MELSNIGFLLSVTAVVLSVFSLFLCWLAWMESR